MPTGTVFYILYVLSGAGFLEQAWGGPAMLRMPDEQACTAAKDAMEKQRWVFSAECVKVEIPAK